MTMITGKKRIAIVGFVAAAALVVAPRGAGASGDSPAATDTSAVHYYVSLGDSLASGPQRGGDANDYPDQLYAELKQQDPALQLIRLGCGGETTDSMILGTLPWEGRTDKLCAYPHGSQLAEAVSFVHAHRQFVNLVTIDIGGNDVGLCVLRLDQDCFDAASASAATNLATILSALRDAAGPDLPIVGMNYYDPFLAFWFSSPTAAQITERMVVEFNDVLDSAHGPAMADVETAFQTTDWTLVDGIPLNVLRICQWTRMCTSNPDVHPNTAGHGVIAQAFADVLP